jgi:hypothetical protein
VMQRWQQQTPYQDTWCLRAEGHQGSPTLEGWLERCFARRAGSVPKRDVYETPGTAAATRAWKRAEASNSPDSRRTGEAFRPFAPRPRGRWLTV